MTEQGMKELKNVVRKIATASTQLQYTSRYTDNLREKESINMAHQHIGNAIHTLEALMKRAAEQHARVAVEKLSTKPKTAAEILGGKKPVIN